MNSGNSETATPGRRLVVAAAILPALGIQGIPYWFSQRRMAAIWRFALGVPVYVWAVLNMAGAFGPIGRMFPYLPPFQIVVASYLLLATYLSFWVEGILVSVFGPRSGLLATILGPFVALVGLRWIRQRDYWRATGRLMGGLSLAIGAVVFLLFAGATALGGLFLGGAGGEPYVFLAISLIFLAGYILLSVRETIASIREPLSRALERRPEG